MCRSGSGDPELQSLVHAGARGGQAPALRGKKRAVYRRARACPSPCLGRKGKWPWSACVFRAGRANAGETRSDARVASEGPRATGPEGVFLAMPRSGAGAPELQFSAPNRANRDNLENLENPAQKSTVHPQSRGPVASVAAAFGGCRGQSSGVSLVN